MLTNVDSTKVTAGLDVGDRQSRFCQVDEAGEVLEEGQVQTSERALRLRFAGRDPMRVVLEVGTHSPWISRLLTELGHEVVVGNPRRLRMIYAGTTKTDRIDAEKLARVGRLDPRLLYPVKHRGREVQEALAVLRSREALVESRTKLVNHVRGMLKSVGVRVPSCSTPSFARTAAEHVPEAMRPAVEPVLETLVELTRKIRGYEREIERLSEEEYPETKLLRQVNGVGAITALAYVLIIEDPNRFATSRAVGSYLGLIPKQDESGERAPELGITKAGNPMLRRLLVGSAHYILGPHGADSDLRRWGQTIAERGRKNQKKRAAVAVARKLAVLLHSLWKTGEVYEPLRNSTRKATSRPQVLMS